MSFIQSIWQLRDLEKQLKEEQLKEKHLKEKQIKE